MAVELRLGEICAGQLQDLVGLAQLAHLALEFLDALLLGVVEPGRTPLSRSPWRTHLRSVSAVQPILPAIDSIAAHCDGYWSLASKTMRTARSMTSGEYFGDFLILAPFSQSKEPPQNPGRFSLGLHGRR
jgi:hypothetical protein